MWTLSRRQCLALRSLLTNRNCCNFRNAEIHVLIERKLHQLSRRTHVRSPTVTFHYHSLFVCFFVAFLFVPSYMALFTVSPSFTAPGSLGFVTCLVTIVSSASRLLYSLSFFSDTHTTVRIHVQYPVFSVVALLRNQNTIVSFPNVETFPFSNVF